MDLRGRNGGDGVSEILQSICIFCNSGRTFTFRGCTIIADNETVLVFRYRAMSDEKEKTATILKSSIVGWSVLM